jgi:hypothetical protein
MLSLIVKIKIPIFSEILAERQNEPSGSDFRKPSSNLAPVRTFAPMSYTMVTARTGNAMIGSAAGRLLAAADAIWTAPAVFPLYLQRVRTSSIHGVRPGPRPVL